VRLLNATMADRRADDPGARVAAAAPRHHHPGYLRSDARRRRYVAARRCVDLARWPRRQRAHTAAYAGRGRAEHLLENRLIVSRLFPRALHGRVRRLASAYRSLLQSMQALSPTAKNSRIVLLTPGPAARRISSMRISRATSG
jgi:hypothetical protein